MTVRLDNLLAYPTYRSRAISANTESLSGFVSNPSDRMIRNSARNARNRAHVAESVCSSKRGESQINKLNRASGPSSGQPDNRKLNEPCARRRIRFFWTRLEKVSVCSAELQLYMELSAWLTGIGFEDRGKRDILNCGDGDIAACSSLDQGSLESKSLFCTNLRETITGRDVCPGIGDNGNGRRLAVTKARRTNALDHGGVSALCLVEGLPARCGKNTCR